MKKVLALLLALVLVLSLAACGGGGSSENKTASTTTKATLDKNDSSNYIGEWETDTFTLTINKGGVGQLLGKSKSPSAADFDWEVKDEVIILYINQFETQFRSVLELNDDGSELNIIQDGLYYNVGADKFTKKK